MSQLHTVRSYVTLLLACLFTWNSNAVQHERSGSLKSIGAFERLRQVGIYEKDSGYYVEERLRLQTSVSGEIFRAEYAGETSLFWQRPNATRFTLPDIKPQSAWNARWTVLSGNEVYALHRIDRLNLQATLGNIQVLAGKQVIATGVGQFFSCVSQVQRDPYIVVDTEYQKTEDALSAIWSGPLQIEARFLPKVGTQKEPSFHIRAKGSKEGYDVAMTAGRSDDKPYVAIESAGNLSDALIRGEVTSYFLPQETVVQGLVGFDYVYSAKWSGKVEAFFNGFGTTNSYVFESYRHRSAPYRGRWYGAVEVAWEAHPLLKIRTHWVTNVADPSLLLHVYLNYSLGNNLDILAGNYQGFGSGRSEFGGRIPTPFVGVEMGYPDLTYAALRYYF